MSRMNGKKTHTHTPGVLHCFRLVLVVYVLQYNIFVYGTVIDNRKLLLLSYLIMYYIVFGWFWFPVAQK